MSCLFVLDIDGTIANAGRRFAEAGPEPSRNDRAVYDMWVRNVQNERSLMEDQPVPGMASLVAGLIAAPFNHVVYLTSREERWREVTESWLDNKEFVSLPLVMRDNNDYTEGAEYKEKAITFLQRLYGASEVVVFDDDEGGTIEPMCHKNGWTFLKAKSGGNK